MLPQDDIVKRWQPAQNKYLTEKREGKNFWREDIKNLRHVCHIVAYM